MKKSTLEGPCKSLGLRDEVYACAIALLRSILVQWLFSCQYLCNCSAPGNTCAIALLLSILVPRTLPSTTRTCHALHSEWLWSFVIGTGLAGVTLSTVSELRQVAEYCP